MTSDQRREQMAEKLVERRDLLKQVRGDQYRAAVAPFRRLLLDAQLPGEGILAVAIRQCKREDATPLIQWSLMAAAVDLLEEGRDVKHTAPSTRRVRRISTR